MVTKKEKYDGRSRPTNQAYEESWNRIFGSNPVAKDRLELLSLSHKSLLLKNYIIGKN